MTKVKNCKHNNSSLMKVPSLDTIIYLAYAREKLGKDSSLHLLDLNKIRDIAVGIKIFEDLEIEHIVLILKNLDSIALQRGCPHQCVHCGTHSGKKISTMSWENFTNFADGFGHLKKRLGFNPLDISPVYPFRDSDAMIYRVKDKNGQIKTIYNAAKYFFEKTGIKFNITTAGWFDSISQQAAENLVKDSNGLGNLNISIHPFHNYLDKVKEYKEKAKECSNTVDAEQLSMKAEKWRTKYIDMISNVIKTTIKLKDRASDEFQYRIFFEYLASHDSVHKEYYSKKAALELLREIFIKVDSDGVDISHFYKGNLKTDSPDDFKKNLRMRKTIFPRNITFTGKANLNLNIDCTESAYWDKIEKAKQEIPYKKPIDVYSSNKIINVDGTIILNFDSPGSVHFEPVKLPAKLNFEHPTNFIDDTFIAELSIKQQEQTLEYIANEKAISIST